MTFSVRKTKSLAFEEALERAFRRREEVSAVQRIGYEHFVRVGMLRKLTYCPEAAKALRYLPDFLLVNTDGEFFYIEAKWGLAIEKNAYQAYLAINDHDLPVLVFFCTGGRVYWQTLETLVFKDSKAVVESFPEDQRFPVKDGWICPPRGVKPEMSGTPFKYVAVESLIEYDDTELLEEIEDITCQKDLSAA